MAHCSWQHCPDPLIPESKTRPLGTRPRLHRRAGEKCKGQSRVNCYPNKTENLELPRYLDWARIKFLLQSRSLSSKAKYREMKLSLHAYHTRRHLGHIPHSFWASVSIIREALLKSCVHDHLGILLICRFFSGEMGQSLGFCISDKLPVVAKAASPWPALWAAKEWRQC